MRTTIEILQCAKQKVQYRNNENKWGEILCVECTNYLRLIIKI